MALNFRNRGASAEDAADSTEDPTATTDGVIDATETESDGEAAAPARRRRRGTRGGRSRSAASAATTEEAAEEPPAPARATTRRRKPAAVADEETETPAPKRAAPRRQSAAATAEAEDEAAPKRAAPRRRKAATEPEGEAALVAALREQNEKLSRLVDLQEQAIERLSGGGDNGTGAATLPRVGIFVDSANVELARDRSRGGKAIDWGLVLDRLTKDRRLVRAVAYSPVHDDPGVSRETQRFVEPFLGKGYKIVTKPLKRFADGSIKANLDIELALDLITMADRLDVAVIISGDGDFQHLVEVVQGRGVRVEVAGLGSSVASALKNAADRYVELDFAQK